jgi:3-(3-hydroxy-phenyl)propionate hydroxylase
LGAELKTLETKSGEAAATIETQQGSALVRAAFIVGCDGASSNVRTTLGIELEDLEFDEPWLVIDAIPRPGCRLPELNLQICDPARPTTCVQMGPGRHRWEFMLLPHETAGTVLEDGFIRALLAKWDVDVTIERKAVYRFHGLIARQWRKGRVILAGDSAHQTPPFAGQGMCAGIRDAANISWKLAAVLRDGATHSLLDSYQLEREPNTRAHISAAIEMGRVVCTLDPHVAMLRDERMLNARREGRAGLPRPAIPTLQGPFVLEGSAGAGRLFPQPTSVRDGHVRRFDDVAGLGAWLISRSAVAQHTGISTYETADLALGTFREQLERWLAAHECAAVLVRPDRHIFGTGDPHHLAREWKRRLSMA